MLACPSYRPVIDYDIKHNVKNLRRKISTLLERRRIISVRLANRLLDALQAST